MSVLWSRPTSGKIGYLDPPSDERQGRAAPRESAGATAPQQDATTQTEGGDKDPTTGHLARLRCRGRLV